MAVCLTDSARGCVWHSHDVLLPSATGEVQGHGWLLSHTLGGPASVTQPETAARCRAMDEKKDGKVHPDEMRGTSRNHETRLSHKTASLEPGGMLKQPEAGRELPPGSHLGDLRLGLPAVSG